MEFMHVADVHLGAAPDGGFPWSEIREQEIWESFQNVIETAAREKIDLLLIAGDLFHGQPLLRQLREVAALFAGIPETQVVIIAGNHDHLKKGSNYLKVSWPDNVTGLWENQCQGCYLEKINTCVYGFSYSNREIGEPIYNQVFPGGRENLFEEYPGARHILLAHGGDEKHVPIRYRELANEEFDYIALGHIHQPEILVPGKMAYAGSLEPLDKNHIGPRGYIRGRITENGTEIMFVPAAKREYNWLKAAVTPESTNISVAAQIQSWIRNQNPDWVYRVVLEGYKDPSTTFSKERIKALGNVVEVVDNTVPEYNFSEMMEEYTGTVLGEYIRHFIGGDKPLTEVEKKALYYGVQALLEARE